METMAHAAIFVLAQEDLTAIWRRHLFTGMHDQRALVPKGFPFRVPLGEQQSAAPSIRMGFRTPAVDGGVFASWPKEVTKCDADRVKGIVYNVVESGIQCPHPAFQPDTRNNLGFGFAERSQEHTGFYRFQLL